MLRTVGSADASGHALVWVIESPTPGVVLVSAELPGVMSATPLHWRAGDWTKPPLDISVNSTDGHVQAIQFVLQDEHLSLAVVPDLPKGEEGIPVVETLGWPRDSYQDVRCTVGAVRSSTGELVITLGSEESVHGVRVLGALAFGWDDSAHLSQVRIGPLSAAEWDAIEAFSAVG